MKTVFFVAAIYLACGKDQLQFEPTADEGRILSTLSEYDTSTGTTEISNLAYYPENPEQAVYSPEAIPGADLTYALMNDDGDNSNVVTHSKQHNGRNRMSRSFTIPLTATELNFLQSFHGEGSQSIFQRLGLDITGNTRKGVKLSNLDFKRSDKRRTGPLSSSEISLLRRTNFRETDGELFKKFIVEMLKSKKGGLQPSEEEPQLVRDESSFRFGKKLGKDWQNKNENKHTMDFNENYQDYFVDDEIFEYAKNKKYNNRINKGVSSEGRPVELFNNSRNKKNKSDKNAATNLFGIDQEQSNG